MIKCSPTTRALCEDNSCDTCFNKSFASHYRSKYWNYQLNEGIHPREIFKSANKKLYFTCEACLHVIHKDIHSIVQTDSWCSYCSGGRWKHCDDLDCKFCYEKSFASHEMSKFWDYEKNERDPLYISKGSQVKYAFNCDECKHTFRIDLSRVCAGSWCSYCKGSSWKHCDDTECDFCYEKSFASHPKSKQWNYEKNMKSPLYIAKGSKKKYFLDCENCNHAISISLSNVIKGHWCSYCSGSRWKHCEDIECMFCYKKSFASHPKSKYWNYQKNEKWPLYISKSSRSKCHIDCPDCEHTYITSVSHIYNNSGCTYCSSAWKHCGEDSCLFCFNRSFSSIPNSKYWNKELNGNIKPKTIPKNAGSKFWFTCNKCKKEFESRICHVSSGTWCPFCKLKTEEKLQKWLTEEYPSYKIIHQFKPIWCKKESNHFYSFDFAIPEINVIIELDGDGHFTQVFNWKSPEFNQENDVLKMKRALSNDYSVIRLYQMDLLKDNCNWDKKLKELINEYSILIDEPTMLYIESSKSHVNKVYKEYISRLSITNTSAEFNIKKLTI